MTSHVETVQAAYGAFGRGDVPAILAMLADDVAWEHDWGGAQLKWYVTRRGPQEAAGFFATLADFDGVLRRIRLIQGITSSETTLLLTTPRSTRARL